MPTFRAGTQWAVTGTDLWGIDLAFHSKTCIALVYTLLLIYAECFSWPNTVLLETLDVLLLPDKTPAYTDAKQPSMYMLRDQRLGDLDRQLASRRLEPDSSGYLPCWCQLLCWISLLPASLCIVD